MARKVAETATPTPKRAPGPSKGMGKALASVAGRFKAWKPAAQVLVEVQAVPTFFPQLDRVSRVGGWPISRFALVHGPSNEGKTELTHGLGASFLARDHFYGFIDAEQTTPHSWVAKLAGTFANSPGFVALRPTTFEETVQAVREFCTMIAEARIKGEIDESTTGLIVLDSIRKLVPKKFLDELLKSASGGGSDKPAPAKGGRFGKKDMGIDGAGGRAGQIKALLNAAWLDELIPLLAQTRVAMACISRETEVEAENPFASGPDIKIGGGKALFYDSSLVVRVTRDCFLYETNEKGAPIVGEKRAIEVHKTKLAGREDRWPTAHYFTSNGRIAPEGFDRVRDVLDLALQLDVCETSGSWLAFQGEKLGNGLNNTLATLRGNDQLVANIEAAIVEHDAKLAA